MSRDDAAAFCLIVTLAAWATSHVVLAVRLVRRKPRWRAVVAFFVLPLMPYWAARAGLKGGAISWGVMLAMWGVARALLAG